MEDDFVSTDHLILGLAIQKGQPKRLLELVGLTEKQIGNAISEIRGFQKVTDQNPEDKFQALERFAVNLV